MAMLYSQRYFHLISNVEMHFSSETTIKSKIFKIKNIDI